LLAQRQAALNGFEGAPVEFIGSVIGKLKKSQITPPVER
jgi:hypothetical protein